MIIESKNYTAIPNVILDELMCKLKPNEFKILMWMFRNSHLINLNENGFSIRDLEDGINLSRNIILRALNKFHGLALVEVITVVLDPLPGHRLPRQRKRWKLVGVKS